jgi:hypothetical protein
MLGMLLGMSFAVKAQQDTQYIPYKFDIYNNVADVYYRENFKTSY